MADKYDVEEAMMSCWRVVDDLRTLLDSDSVNNSTVTAVADLYEVKFRHAVNVLEQAINQGKLDPAFDIGSLDFASSGTFTVNTGSPFSISDTMWDNSYDNITITMGDSSDGK